MIDAAVHAGADAVKFQKRTPEICTPPDQQKQMRETPWGYITYLDYRYKVEFNEEQYREIDRYCKEKGIAWMVSVWDEPSVDFMEKFDTPAYKIPSASLTDHNLIETCPQDGQACHYVDGHVHDGADPQRRECCWRRESGHHALHQHLSLRT